MTTAQQNRPDTVNSKTSPDDRRNDAEASLQDLAQDAPRPVNGPNSTSPPVTASWLLIVGTLAGLLVFQLLRSVTIAWAAWGGASLDAHGVDLAFTLGLTALLVLTLIVFFRYRREWCQQNRWTLWGIPGLLTPAVAIANALSSFTLFSA